MKKIFNALILISFFAIQNSLAMDFDTNNYQKSPPVYGHYAIGDLNGDGLDDVFFTGYNKLDAPCNFGTCPPIQSTIYPTGVLLNDGNGQFVDFKQNSILNIDSAYKDGYSYPVLVSIVDLDNDGDNDIVNSKGHVLLNDGYGQLAPPITIDIPESTNPILAVDLNNNGVFELVYNYGIYKRTTLSPINFSLQKIVWQEGQSVKVADVSNDGFKDLIVFGDDNPISLLINDGQGHFPENLRISLSNSESLMLVVGDVDNDNDADIILSNGTILQNNLNLDFIVVENGVDLSEYNSNEEIYLRELVNFNGDNFFDLLVDAAGQNFILINDGTGNFNFDYTSVFHLRDYNLSNTKSIVTPIKFNRDGYTDFISLNLLYENYADYSYQWYITSSSRLLIHENNQQEVLKLSPLNQLEYSKPSLFDSDADGKKELLISSSYKYWKNSDSFFLKDLNMKEINIQSLPDFLQEGNKVSKKTVISADFNMDGYEDLLMQFLLEEDFYSHSFVSKIFFNSESGFSQGNSIDLLVDGVHGSGYDYFYSVEDFNGDGFVDIITSQGLLINNGDNSFIQIKLPQYENIDGEPHVADFNLDGVMDFAYANYIYQIDSSNLVMSTPIQVGNEGNQKFIDYNKDGLIDMFVYIPNRNIIEKYRNTGNFNFSLKNVYQYHGATPMGHVDITDLENDGVMDVVAEVSSPYQLNLYHLVGGDIEFVRVIDDNVNNHGRFRLFHDFDGDNKLDIYFAGKIYYYREFSFLPGLNYDPTHNGHGFSIEPIGSLGEFYTVFYTYGEDGFPEWYSDLGVFEQTEGDYWNINSNRSDFIRYQYNYDTNTASKNQDELEKGYISQAQCSDEYGSIGINFNKKFNPIFIDYTDKINWCSEANIAYVQRPNDNISGLWWAGLNDSGWGWSMSLQERADTTALVVVLYYYDGQGNPRWLLGLQEGFEFGQEISVDMKMYNGYARAATPVDLTTTPAGTMKFTINNPVGTNTYTGTMSMNVSYPGAEGGHWQRDNITISRQSNPRR